MLLPIVEPKATGHSKVKRTKLTMPHLVYEHLGTNKYNPTTQAGIPLFAPEKAFSRGLRVTSHCGRDGEYVREVFGHIHLRGGGGLSARLEGLPHALDLARLYLSIHELDQAERTFRRIVKLCLAASPGEVKSGSLSEVRRSTACQQGYDPFVYASACVGLARVLISRLRGEGQGQLGVDAHNADDNAWLKLPSAAEDAVRLVNRGIRAASEAGTPAEHIFLGEALGCLGELLEVLPDLLGPGDRSASGESCDLMKTRIAECYVSAIALCAGGINDHKDLVSECKHAAAQDPQKRPMGWCENAVIDMVRIQGAAARCVEKGVNSNRFRGLARQVAALAAERFGHKSTIVAQALHDLGRVEAKAQSVSGAHPRDSWDFIEAARQAYQDSGLWPGTSEVVQCLSTLTKVSRLAGHVSEAAHHMARSAANANLQELRAFPQNKAAAQSLARAVGEFSKTACLSGNVLGAVDLEFRAKEELGSDGHLHSKTNLLERKDCAMSKKMNRAAAKDEMLRRTANVWARTARLPTSNPYTLPRASAIRDEEEGDPNSFVKHIRAKLSPRKRQSGRKSKRTDPWSP